MLDVRLLLCNVGFGGVLLSKNITSGSFQK